MEDNVLLGLRIIITRPAHQADSLCNLLSENGAKITKFPVIEIVDSKDETFFKNLANNLHTYNKAIFISPNAVLKGLCRVLLYTHWPAQVKIVAIGNSTANTLKEHNQPAQIVPTRRFDTESLLELDAMQRVKGEKIAIFRGNGGRERLAEVLTQRGALVEYIECYKRVIPKIDSDIVNDQLRKNNIDLISVTSNQGLQHLYEMIGSKDRAYLLSTRLLVTSHRILPEIRNLGFKLEPIIASNTSNQAILEAIIDFFSTGN